MPIFPQATIANPYQIFGQALTQAGGQVTDFVDNQTKLRQMAADLAQKKAAAILAQQAAATEEQQKQFTLKDAMDKKAEADAFKAKVQAGVTVPGATTTTPAVPATPDITAPSAPVAQSDQSDLQTGKPNALLGMTPQAPPVAPQTLPVGLSGIPEQTTTAPDTKRPMSSDEMKAALLQSGTVSPDKMYELMKGAKINYQNIGGHKIAINQDTGETTDLGPIAADTASPYTKTALAKIADLIHTKAGTKSNVTSADVLSIANEVDPTGAIYKDPNFTKAISRMPTADQANNQRALVGWANLDFQKEKFQEQHVFDDGPGGTGKVLHPLTKDVGARFQAMTAASNSLIKLKNVLDSLPDAERGPVISSALGITGLIKYSPAQAVAASLIKETAGHLANSFGQSGHTAEGEIKDMQSLFPSGANPKDVANALYSNLGGKLVDLWGTNRMNAMKSMIQVPDEYGKAHTLHDMAIFGLDPNDPNQMAGLGESSDKPYTPPAVGYGDAPAPTSGPVIHATGTKKALDAMTAGKFLKEAGGDRALARKNIIKAGYAVK